MLTTLRSIPRRTLVLVTLLSLVVAAGAGWAYERATAPDEPTFDEQIRLTPEDADEAQVVPAGPDGGKRVPTLRLARLDEGLGSLADYRGKPLVVNVFSTTCAPCIKEMPALEQVHGELGADVAFVGVALNDSRREAQALVDRTGVTYDVILDPAGKLWGELGGQVMPTTFLVSADGEIVEARPGAATASEFRRLIEQRLLS